MRGSIRRHEEFAPVDMDAFARIFVLTGAGISAESGISTFRDAGGLWEKHRVEEVASPEGWRRDPGLVWRFYAARRAQAVMCVPNSAHVALATLEARMGARLFVCTQNVDHLHEKAGSKHVVHMHGELFRSRCEACDLPDFEDARAYASLDEVPRCACGGRLRPHICWFGEMPFAMDPIADALDACDLFVTVGSSGSVYPAAGFVSQIASRNKKRGDRATSIYVGPEPPDNARAFDECRIGNAGDVLPRMFGA